MPRFFFVIVLVTLLSPILANADDCTHQWIQNLSINPSSPKTMSGDSYAAYGLFSWYDDPSLRIIFKGNFFEGRFMSLESYFSQQKIHHDALMDYQIAPDAGSSNPFQIGVPYDVPNRSYTVEVAYPRSVTFEKNVLTISRVARIHSVFFRAYVPNQGVTITAKDLPRILVYHSRTGRPARCPRPLDTVFDPGFLAKAFINMISKDNTILFKESSFWNGTNHAIPKYVTSISKINRNDVSVIRFKAPTSTKTDIRLGSSGRFLDEGQVRYWSLCSQNIAESQTLTCLPDYLARIDENGYVTVAVGKGLDVARKARELGMTFLEDRRGVGQDIQGLFYRNLLAKPGFPAYRGEYLPVGIVCPRQAFLAGYCK